MTDSLGTPPPSSPVVRPTAKLPWIVAAVAIVIALAAGGFTLWSSGQTDPEMTDLRSELDSARADLADVEAELERVNASAGAAAGDVVALQTKIDALTKKLSKSVSTQDLPVVVYERAGLGDNALFEEFTAKLIQPMVQWTTDVDMPPLLAFVIEIPESEGEPFTYTAIWAGGQSEGALFGTRGEPLPTWEPACVTEQECSELG